jgi:hypothetical protein
LELRGIADMGSVDGSLYPYPKSSTFPLKVISNNRKIAGRNKEEFRSYIWPTSWDCICSSAAIVDLGQSVGSKPSAMVATDL